MDKIKLIEQAIERADSFDSKIKTLPAYEVPALASLKIRCLLNNLGELAENYLECGVHRGGTFCSTIADNRNIKKAFAVDSWASDHMAGEIHETQFLESANANVSKQTELIVIKDDCFSVDLSKIDSPIDMFLYDAGHSKEDQKNALIYYYPVLANEFIYLCDDWQFEQVKEGTLEGIKEMGFEVLFEKELLTDKEYNNESWWRGYYVALLKKIKK